MSLYGLALISTGLLVSLAGQHLASPAVTEKTKLETSKPTAGSESEQQDCELVIKASFLAAAVPKQPSSVPTDSGPGQLELELQNRCSYTMALIEFQVETLGAAGAVKFEDLAPNRSAKKVLTVASRRGFAVRSIVVVDSEARRQQPRITRQFQIQ